LGNEYVFIKDVKDSIISNFKVKNLEIPIELLKDFIIDLQNSIGSVINLTFIYLFMMLLGYFVDF
jgi:hypothetical protein